MWKVTRSAAIVSIYGLLIYSVACSPREIDVEIENACIKDKFIQRLKLNNFQYALNDRGWIVYSGNKMKEFERIDEEFKQWEFGTTSVEEVRSIMDHCPVLR